ncbi:MAG: YegP family protein [Mobilitalea sp.]
MAGKFVIKETNTGVNFSLKAGNGEVIGVSQVYSSEKACRDGIESVKKYAPNAEIEDQTEEGYGKVKNPKYEVYENLAKEFRFRLNAKNGENILTGEGYKSLAGCLKGIESIKTNAADAEIVKAE